MAKRYKTTVETENKTKLKGVDRQPAGFTIWVRKYRKESHRNTTEEKAKLCICHSYFRKSGSLENN